MNEPLRIKIIEYNDIGDLETLLVDSCDVSDDVVKSKPHIQIYFREYLKGVKAKCILAEFDYIDHDFLEDFAGYYVRCFHDYPRKCVRLHFFRKVVFDEDDFHQICDGSHPELSHDILGKHYLGFMVIKPLPETIIGRTCLVTYSVSPDKHRCYPAVKKYACNVFGLPFKFKSLAFQEQDHVAAACATSALWSVFQGTAKLFQHHVPSPLEITKMATENLPLVTRSFPNEGLSIPQIAQAIRAVGLEPFSASGRDDDLLKGRIYAYLSARIPLLLGVDLVELPILQGKSGASLKKARFMGKHAVAVTGFRLNGGVKPAGLTGFLSKSSRMTKVYAHDDQVGPFARMEFGAGSVSYEGAFKEEPKRDALSTSWPDDHGNLGRIRAVPDILFIPLYHKIRIPYNAVRRAVISFDVVLEHYRLKVESMLGAAFLEQRIEWDIRLSTVQDYKRSFIKSPSVEEEPSITPELRQEILLEEMPRFIWRATAETNGRPVLELLFDATDIEQGSFFLRALEYHEPLSAVLRRLAQNVNEIEEGLAELAKRIEDIDVRLTLCILKWFQGKAIGAGRATDTE